MGSENIGTKTKSAPRTIRNIEEDHYTVRGKGIYFFIISIKKTTLVRSFSNQKCYVPIKNLFYKGWQTFSDPSKLIFNIFIKQSHKNLIKDFWDSDNTKSLRNEKFYFFNIGS